MATPTYSGIPYPMTTTGIRRDTLSGTDLRRGSFGQGTISLTSGYGVDSAMIPTSMGSGTMISGLRGVPSVETLTESLMPKRVHQMDMEFQKVKLYDLRKRPDSQIFEESNGAMFSNYIAQRTSRVVGDYKSFKYEEARQMGHQFSGSFLSEQQRKASSLSLTLRAGSGSFTQLNQIPPSRIEESGPVEIMEWFARDNGKEHRTDQYEVALDYRRGHQIAVYRRGQTFFMAMKMSTGRSGMDLQRTPIFVTFNFGNFQSRSCLYASSKLLQ